MSKEVSLGGSIRTGILGTSLVVLTLQGIDLLTNTLPSQSPVVAIGADILLSLAGGALVGGISYMVKGQGDQLPIDDKADERRVRAHDYWSAVLDRPRGGARTKTARQRRAEAVGLVKKR